MSPDQAAKLRKLRDDFEFFAAHCLKIRTKSGAVVPFKLNRAQKYLHSRLEDQRKATGKVRAIVLKGRQLGASTYIQGRFYWRLWGGKGLKAFILTHEQDATDNMFAMAKRYHENCPPEFQHPTQAANAKELAFAGRDCSYAVATAGSKGVGRSSTLQLFHGCLGSDTPIIDGLTGRLVQMGDVRVGDMVRTHRGNVAPVSFISRQAKAARSVVFKGLRDFPLTSTDEHRFWTKDGWKELASIKVGEFVGLPVAKITDEVQSWPFRLPDSVRPQGGGSREVGPDALTPSYALGRVLGLYLAEGTVSLQSSNGRPACVSYAVHERELDRTIEWLEPFKDCFRSINVRPVKDSKTVHVTVYGRSFASFVLGMCGRVTTKALPADWRVAGEEFARGLAHGYLAGDGHSESLTRRISAPSIRSTITIGMRDVLASLGYGFASIAHKDAAVRYGRSEQEAWNLRLTGPGVDRLASEIGWLTAIRQREGNYGTVEVSDGYAWVAVSSIVDAGTVEVMDFEIDHEDHSYCTIHGATHNSEVGFWPNAETHIDGAFQAIADVDGTERLLESTANGIGNVYQRRYGAAARGESEEEAIFIPWFWGEDYEKEVPDGWDPPSKRNEDTLGWAEYALMHKLTWEQLYWAYSKNRDMATAISEPDDTPCWKFQQEYPATAQEAFATSGNSFIPSTKVAMARKAKVVGIGPLIIGIDPAGGGKDTWGAIDRCGRRLGQRVCERWSEKDTMICTGKVVALIKKLRPAAVNIDVGGLGAPIYDRLVELGYGYVVNPVNFGSSPLGIGPTGDELYANRRAEMWDIKRAWYDSPGGVQVPDDDSFHGDETAPQWGPGQTRLSSNNELTLEPKDKIRARVGFSPDLGDASALTFAVPIAETPYEDEGMDERAHGRSQATGY